MYFDTYDEAVAAAIKSLAGGLISFGGDDNCEGCGGWDGKSRRCECGNRRVYWEHDKYKGKVYVYAQAY